MTGISKCNKHSKTYEQLFCQSSNHSGYVEKLNITHSHEAIVYSRKKIYIRNTENTSRTKESITQLLLTKYAKKNKRL